DRAGDDGWRGGEHPQSPGRVRPGQTPGRRVDRVQAGPARGGVLADGEDLAIADRGSAVDRAVRSDPGPGEGSILLLQRVDRAVERAEEHATAGDGWCAQRRRAEGKAPQPGPG